MTRPEGRPARLPLSRIRPDPANPRHDYDRDRLKELGASIRANGQWVRVIVRPDPDEEGFFRLVDGHRRCKAMQEFVSATEIDVEIVDGPLDKGQLLMVQTSLGLTSEKLDHLELGEACEQLMEAYGLTPEELADRLGTSLSTISKLGQLHAGLVECLRGDVKSGAIPYTVGYQLARLEKCEAEQVRLASLFKAKQISREGIAAAVNRILGTAKPKDRLMKACADGATVILPEGWAPAKIVEFANRIAEAARKVEKNQLPVSSFPSVFQKP